MNRDINKDKKKQIIIVEDHAIVREGIRALLSNSPFYEIIDEAADGFGAIQSVGYYVPDLVLMDLSMPRMNGIDATREIKKSYQDIKILVMTSKKNEDFMFWALDAGADGYIIKDSTKHEFEIAIMRVLNGFLYISPEFTRYIVDWWLDSKKFVYSGSWTEVITQSEKKILKLIAEGYRTKEIADLLSISTRTVQKHRENLMNKLDIHNVARLTSFAIEKGLISK